MIVVGYYTYTGYLLSRVKIKREIEREKERERERLREREREQQIINKIEIDTYLLVK